MMKSNARKYFATNKSYKDLLSVVLSTTYRIAGNFQREKFSEISEKTNDFRKYIS